MIRRIITACKNLVDELKACLKRWTKPAPASLVVGTLSDLPRSKAELVAENALLRQQLIVLRRQVKRPQLTPGDRLRLMLLARCTRHWQTALHIVQPDTLLRWHRDLFRHYWRWKSRSKTPQPRIPQAAIDLIQQMTRENRLWGAERIRGELLKLGIKVSKRTVQRYMPTRHRRSNQNWATFLKNHADEIWACDFTVVHDLLFRPVYVFLIMQLSTRRIIHTAVTRTPTDVWTAQQLREATPWQQRPAYLIRDRDTKYGSAFSQVAQSTQIEELVTPIRAPKANAVCERTIGGLKRECLDHVLITNQRQLHRVVKEYADYYNDSRPHQGIDQRVPGRYDKLRAEPATQPHDRVISRPILNGLHHHYAYG